LEILSLVFFLVAAGVIINPVLYYLQHRSVAEWMIYRFVTSDVCGIAACVCISASSVADRMIRIALFDEIGERPRSRLESFFSSRWFWTVPVLLVLTGGALVISSFLSLLRTGAIYEHWSRFLVMSFCASSAVMLMVTRLLHYALNLVEERMKYWRTSGELVLPEMGK
jgi:hypothetical protein